MTSGWNWMAADDGAGDLVLIAALAGSRRLLGGS
jgi:hypothetical protein